VFVSRRKGGITLRHLVQWGHSQLPVELILAIVLVGVKLPKRETGHSPAPSSAGFKNAGSYLGSPRYLCGVMLI